MLVERGRQSNTKTLLLFSGPRRGFRRGRLAGAAQQRVAPEGSSCGAFRPAPASGSLLINRVPVSALPSDPALLQKTIADAVHLATGIAIGSARTLLPWDRITKLTTSLVIQVPPTDVPLLVKNGILLFNRIRPVRAMWSATPATQCTLCWQFGHPAAGCPKGPPTLSAVASVATQHTQPELTPALNASQDQLCQRRSMVYALTPHPSASIAVPTTQPTLPLARSALKRLRNSAPAQTNWFEAPLPVK